jgi:hypothetical protein
MQKMRTLPDWSSKGQSSARHTPGQCPLETIHWEPMDTLPEPWLRGPILSVHPLLASQCRVWSWATFSAPPLAVLLVAPARDVLACMLKSVEKRDLGDPAVLVPDKGSF